MHYSEPGLWAIKHRADDTLSDVIVKLTEELGELAHAHYRLQRSSKAVEVDQYNLQVDDAIGDLAITLMVYAYRAGVDYDRVIREVWDRVKERT